MSFSRNLLAVLGLITLSLAGCHHDEGPVGLSGHDVKAASDQMAADLLSLPALNASTHQWTIVVGSMRDETVDHTFATNYDIFLARLKTNLARMSNGRVTLIQNRAAFHDIRSKELDTPSERDDYGQTGGQAGGPPARAAINPDFQLDGVAHDLPNRGSNYFLLEFNLNNLRDRTIPWSNQYEVTLPR